jgi:hypothetical protein
LFCGQRVVAGAQQLAGGQVVEHQRGWLDPDADPAAAEDLRGEQLAPGQADQADAGNAAFDLDGVAVLDRRQRGGTGRYRSLGDEPGQVSL